MAHIALQAETTPLRLRLVFLRFSVSIWLSDFSVPFPTSAVWPQKWVWASARKKRLAAARSKPNALLAPPERVGKYAASQIPASKAAARAAQRGRCDWPEVSMATRAFILRFFNRSQRGTRWQVCFSAAAGTSAQIQPQIARRGVSHPSRNCGTQGLTGGHEGLSCSLLLAATL